MAELKINSSLLLKYIYPVGSIYMSVNATSPATFIGGTWERIQGRFLWGADSTITAGEEGGEQNHTLVEKEMPKHRHYGVFRRDNSWCILTEYDGGGSIGYKHGEGPVEKKAIDLMTEQAGGNAPHNNMPPYLSVYIWKRTK